MSTVENFLNEHADRFVEEFVDFLRIPSISALPEHADDVQRAADWVAARMESAGIEDVRIMPTAGHPMVYGEWLHAPGKPTILVYGHFDTQPVDPLEAWTHPPFEPHIENGRVYARGATDDKGSMLVPILATEALLKTAGSLPINVKFLFEGEEESGSANLPEFLETNRELLACDLGVSADSIQWSEDQPALLLGWKGLCSIQIDVQGPQRDLHSGVYGGSVENPIHALAHILDSMRDKEGRILVEGFYDEVTPLTDEERSQYASIPFDPSEYQDEVGVKALVSEPGYTPRETAWARPTVEANGIWGGFQGEGAKTIIPQQAHAKISCRLVPNQNPDRIVQLLIKHIEKHTPPGVTVSVRVDQNSGRPYLMPADHPGHQAAAAVLSEVYGPEPYYTRCGGTLPICSLVQETLGVYTMMFGFILNDECCHAPDEFFRLKSFVRAQQAFAKLYHKLAEPEIMKELKNL